MFSWVGLSAYVSQAIPLYFKSVLVLSISRTHLSDRFLKQKLQVMETQKEKKEEKDDKKAIQLPPVDITGVEAEAAVQQHPIVRKSAGVVI